MMFQGSKPIAASTTPTRTESRIRRNATASGEPPRKRFRPSLRPAGKSLTSWAIAKNSLGGFDPIIGHGEAHGEPATGRQSPYRDFNSGKHMPRAGCNLSRLRERHRPPSAAVLKRRRGEASAVAQRRVRALASWGIPMWRHPLPSPLPQAGEGAHLLCGNTRTHQHLLAKPQLRLLLSSASFPAFPAGRPPAAACPSATG